MKTFGDVLNGRTRTGKGRFVLASGMKGGERGGVKVANKRGKTG